MFHPGVTADGQYVASSQFATQVLTRCQRDDVPFAVPVSWDAAHLLNLAFTDVREGKVGGDSAAYLAQFIAKVSVFNTELNFGKGNSFLRAAKAKTRGPGHAPNAYSKTRLVQWVQLLV